MITLLSFLLLGFSTTSTPSSLTGDWLTSNKSVVRVFNCSGQQLCAKVVTVGPKNEPQTDVNNPDSSLRSRAICGLTIGTAFTPDGDQSAKDGKIYDPESGKTYSAQMEASGNELKLRGYVGISLLGRTETWHRTENVAAVCQ